MSFQEAYRYGFAGVDSLVKLAALDELVPQSALTLQEAPHV